MFTERLQGCGAPRRSASMVLYAIVAGWIMLLLASFSLAYTWEILTEEDGLINDLVLPVFGSRDGSVWIGCFGEGVCRYRDGQITSWPDPGDGSVPVDVRDFCEDGQGTLWCITFMDGCWFYQNGLWHRERRFEYKWPRMGAVPPRAYCGDTIQLGPDGRLWGAFGAGIMWFDPVTGESQKVWETPRRYEWDFYYCPEKMLVSTSDGIWFESGHEILQIDYTGHLLSTNLGFDQQGYDEAWGMFAEDPSGELWFCGAVVRSMFDALTGLFRLGAGGWAQVEPPGGFVDGSTPIHIAPNGELICFGACFAPGRSSGLWTYNGSDWSLYDCPLYPSRCYYPRSVAVDTCGNIWVPVGVGPRFFTRQGAGVAVCWRGRSDGPAAKLRLVSAMAGEVPRFRFRQAERIEVQVDATTYLTTTVDCYLALQVPSGELLFWPELSDSAAAFMRAVHLSAGKQVDGLALLSLTLPDLPQGRYCWYAALTYTGTMDLASNIASCEWEFEK